MSATRSKSIAEQEAEARKNSVLLTYAYLFTTAKGTLLPSQYHTARPELLTVFEELVEAAAKYKRLTGRHLPILGELGELFAEIMLGLRRHDPMAEGSDGTIGGELVEVKTITPDKTNDTVRVKRAGNFVNLIVVKITDDFQFGARMVHRCNLIPGNGGFDAIAWKDMIAGEPDQKIHQSFPFKREVRNPTAADTPDNLELSNYLTEVHQEWESSRHLFPRNTYPPSHWPIPFFGNPAKAIVATVGVNPSSDEFRPSRNWGEVDNVKHWKERLRDYFAHPTTPAHRWFEPWRTGLALLGVSYEKGTATHLDVSYRTTTAMLRNKDTVPKEFRRMVERDAAWFFKLLLLCPNLRLLLTFGPMVRADGSIESLPQFLKSHAPRNGFSFFPSGTGWSLRHEETKRSFCVHNADTPGEKGVTSRVVKNLQAHRAALLEQLRQQS